MNDECNYCGAVFEVSFEGEGWDVIHCPSCGEILDQELNFEDE